MPTNDLARRGLAEIGGDRGIDADRLRQPARAAAIGEIEMQPDPALSGRESSGEFGVVKGSSLAGRVKQIGADEARHSRSRAWPDGVNGVVVELVASASTIPAAYGAV